MGNEGGAMDRRLMDEALAKLTAKVKEKKRAQQAGINDPAIPRRDIDVAREQLIERVREKKRAHMKAMDELTDRVMRKKEAAARGVEQVSQHEIDAAHQELKRRVMAKRAGRQVAEPPIDHSTRLRNNHQTLDERLKEGWAPRKPISTKLNHDGNTKQIPVAKTEVIKSGPPPIPTGRHLEHVMEPERARARKLAEEEATLKKHREDLRAYLDELKVRAEGVHRKAEKLVSKEESDRVVSEIKDGADPPITRFKSFDKRPGMVGDDPRPGSLQDLGFKRWGFRKYVQFRKWRDRNDAADHVEPKAEWTADPRIAAEVEKMRARKPWKGAVRESLKKRKETVKEKTRGTVEDIQRAGALAREGRLKMPPVEEVPREGYEELIKWADAGGTSEEIHDRHVAAARAAKQYGSYGRRLMREGNHRVMIDKAELLLPHVQRERKGRIVKEEPLKAVEKLKENRKEGEESPQTPQQGDSAEVTPLKSLDLQESALPAPKEKGWFGRYIERRRDSRKGEPKFAEYDSGRDEDYKAILEWQNAGGDNEARRYAGFYAARYFWDTYGADSRRIAREDPERIIERARKLIPEMQRRLEARNRSTEEQRRWDSLSPEEKKKENLKYFDFAGI